MTTQIPFDPDFDAPVQPKVEEIKERSPAANQPPDRPLSSASFFDGFSPKAAFIFGLVVAVGAVSIVGSIVLFKALW